MLALSYALSAAAKPKTPKHQAPRPSGLESFQIPSAEEGRPIQVVFGKRRVEGANVVWYGDLRIDPIIRRVKTS